MTCNFRPLGAGAFDAFDTESDALAPGHLFGE